MVTILDYGMGNLGSVLNMFKKVGAEAKITSDLDEIAKAQKILLPGVGAFDTAMRKIGDLGLKEILDEKILVQKVPLLGICLGMQLLTNGSEEGNLPGLGWIDAQTIKFNFPVESNLKVPHMGWNVIHIENENLLLKDLGDEPRFYFVHSYYVKANSVSNVLASTYHGLNFHSVIQRDNVFGAQFHPEKSHRFGMKLIENFSRL